MYGYYADQDNDCQIFHVCLPLQQLYPDNFTQPITFQFSFICPEYTRFSQVRCALSLSLFYHHRYHPHHHYLTRVSRPTGRHGVCLGGGGTGV